jgi:hypothetical protein
MRPVRKADNLTTILCLCHEIWEPKLPGTDQPRGLVVTVSDYWLWGPGFDSRFYHGNFPLQGRIPVVTMVRVVSRFRLKAPPGISSSCISPLTPSGQRNCASWASQPQKSVTLSTQPEGKATKFIGTCGGIDGGGGDPGTLWATPGL